MIRYVKRIHQIILASVLLALVFAGPGGAQQRRAGFSLYARALLNDERKPSIKVSAHVPFSNLVFLREGDAYTAKYRLYIRIFDRSGKNMLDSHVRSKSETVKTYEQTKSSKESSTLSYEIETSPGDYIVRCTVHVTDTHRAFSSETAVAVPDIMQSGVGVTKPRIFAMAVDTSQTAESLFDVEDADEVYLEQQERATFVALDRQPGFQFDVFLEKAVQESTRCSIVYEVVTDDNDQVLYGKRRIWLLGDEDQFVVSFNVDEWEPGAYALNVKATVYSPTRSAVTNLPFDLEFTHAMLTTQWERTVTILSIIGTNKEIARLEDAAPRDRPSAWAGFWARRDPTPGTETNEALDEHFRRVRHTNKQFAANGPGWRTDRGRVYIRHGEPDEEESRSDPSIQGQYLVWRYYEDNLTFVFFDRFGLGEYILSGSNTF